jgi:DNA-binding transcriptional MerR regulator
MPLVLTVLRTTVTILAWNPPVAPSPFREEATANVNRDRSPDTGTTPPTNAYTLDELCAMAGVTVRTVRYYISEGLLPPPTGGGPNARYGDEHLDRLRVIGLLKERYLPLREIRRALEGMTPEEIADTVTVARRDDDSVATRQLAAPSLPPPARMAEESTASDYIASVLDEERRTRGTRYPPHAIPEPESRSWKRIPISGEAELLIDEAAWRRRREQVEALVAWAQRILDGS